jgi:hypothetical protein
MISSGSRNYIAHKHTAMILSHATKLSGRQLLPALVVTMLLLVLTWLVPSAITTSEKPGLG